MERKTGASQKTISRRITKILAHYGFSDAQITCRSRDPNSSNQAFYPDIIATKPKSRYVYEIEANVNNNTIFKSLSSLMKFISEHSSNGLSTKAFLVVPKDRVLHARKCLITTMDLLNFFSKGNQNLKQLEKIQIINFDRVTYVYEHVKNRQCGRRLKCEFS